MITKHLDKNQLQPFAKYIVSLATILIAIIIDQVTKEIVVRHFVNKDHGYILEINNYLNIVLAWNRGISFGMFSQYQASQYIFLILAIIITLAILVYIFFYCSDKIDIIFLSLICGGAIGNIIDRIRYGAVVDFIDIHIKQYSWPAFNFADSVVCVSAIILFMRMNSKGN